MGAPKVGAQRSRAWIPHPGLRQELSLRISGRLVNGIAYISCVCDMATIRYKRDWAKMWVLIAWKTGVISWNALTLEDRLPAVHPRDSGAIGLSNGNSYK
jgi:hypothetical protein